ncbi:MAG: DUF2007 domain-containing protein [Saprospiraceae bacterium]
MRRDDILDDFNFDDSQYFEENSGEVVAKYYSPLEAEVAAARLRSEGIPCFLASSTAQSVMPHLQLLVRLHVRPKDLDRARMLLAEADIDAKDPADESGDNQVFTFLAVLIGLILAALLVRALF